jgi:hypothetical protein
LSSVTRYCLNKGDKFWSWDKYEHRVAKYLCTNLERVENTTTATNVARALASVNPLEVLKSSLVLILSNESTILTTKPEQQI